MVTPDDSFFEQLTPHVHRYGLAPPVLTTLLVSSVASRPSFVDPMLVLSAYAVMALASFCVFAVRTERTPDPASTELGATVYLLGCAITGGLTLALAVLFA